MQFSLNQVLERNAVRSFLLKKKKTKKKDFNFNYLSAILCQKPIRVSKKKMGKIDGDK